MGAYGHIECEYCGTSYYELDSHTCVMGDLKHELTRLRDELKVALEVAFTTDKLLIEEHDRADTAEERVVEPLAVKRTSTGLNQGGIDMTEVRFKQITAATDNEDAVVYGLDEHGNVWEGCWKYIKTKEPIFSWYLLPVPEDDRLERTQFP